MELALLDLLPSLRALAHAIRNRVTPPTGSQPWLSKEPVRMGASDVTFAPDEAAEAVLDGWFAAQARKAPLSLLTEDHGWRHGGPDRGTLGWRALTGFDHGGPRVVVDPIDGTRPWLHGLRSAWTVLAAAGPGAGEPRLSDVEFGLLGELPLPRSASVCWLEASRGNGCTRGEIPLFGQPAPPPASWRTPDLARVDHAFFSFFAYHPAVRAPIDAFALAFFERLERLEGAQIDHCYDDQYIASGGQLALLTLGTYAMVCDPRPRIVAVGRGITQCAKPYDLAGAVLCAREAGCEVLDLDGSSLDFPLDGSTPVGFVAYPGPTSRARLQPHFEVSRSW